MLKDIQKRDVEDIAIAITPRLASEEDSDLFWDAWLINLKPEPIRSVLVNSTGYGKVNEQTVKTSTMRYFWEAIESGMAVKIEPIQTDLFSLSNEYWLSFSLENYLYDKKYVFTPGTLHESNFTKIPLLDRQGVLIR